MIKKIKALLSLDFGKKKQHVKPPLPISIYNLSDDELIRMAAQIEALMIKKNLARL